MKKSTKTIRWFIFTVVSTIIMMTATVFSVSADNVIAEKANAEQQIVTEQAAETSGLVSWIEGLGGTVRTIGMAIGGVAVIVLGVMLIGGGNGAISKTKGVAIGICAGIAVIGFGPAIIAELASATGAK